MEIIEKLNQEILFQTRKMYGMFGQIQFSVTNIDHGNKIIMTSFKIKKEDEYRRLQIKNNVEQSIKHKLPKSFYGYQILVGERELV